MKPITDTLRALTAILLIVAVAINCANVIGRYVFSIAFESAEEIMLFLLVGAVFLGTGVVSWERRQIRMDVIIQALPAPLRAAVELLADLTAIAVCVAIIAVGWPVVAMLAEFDQRSQAANIPLWIPQALIPLGLGLTAILLSIRVIGDLISLGRPGGAQREGGGH